MQKTSMHHPVLADDITQSQMHVQIKHSLAHLQDVANSCFCYVALHVYFIPVKVGIKSCRYARKCFNNLYMHLALSYNSRQYRMVHRYFFHVTGLSWLLICLLFIVIPTSFSDSKFLHTYMYFWSMAII